MNRARDIGAGTILGVVLMLSLISWSEGSSVIAALILALAVQGLALYVAITKLPGTPKDVEPEAPPMKRATVRFGGRKVNFPPTIDDDYHEGATQ